jgi:hypothetical protein
MAIQQLDSHSSVAECAFVDAPISTFTDHFTIEMSGCLFKLGGGELGVLLFPQLGRNSLFVLLAQVLSFTYRIIP